jgi:hypothetical protein
MFEGLVKPEVFYIRQVRQVNEFGTVSFWCLPPNTVAIQKAGCLGRGLDNHEPAWAPDNLVSEPAFA